MEGVKYSPGLEQLSRLITGDLHHPAGHLAALEPPPPNLSLVWLCVRGLSVCGEVLTDGPGQR